jgi:hypothetical protein
VDVAPVLQGGDPVGCCSASGTVVAPLLLGFTSVDSVAGSHAADGVSEGAKQLVALKRD